MPRHPIALALPRPYPLLPKEPASAGPSPLQSQLTTTLSSTDYDTVVLPLTNEKWQERWERLCLRPVEEEDEAGSEQKEREKMELDREADIWRRDGGLRREELNISRLEETQHVIGLASEWLELDSPDEGIRFDSELALRAEVSQALYLSLPTLIIPSPILANRAHLPSYARAISNLLQIGGAGALTQLSIRIPVSDPVELIGQGPAVPQGTGMSESNSAPNNRHKRVSSLSTRPASVHQNQTLPVTPVNQRTPSGASSVASARPGSIAMGSSQTDPSSTWEMWDCIRTMCGYHPRLSVTLDLTNPLPPSVGALARWTAEPTKYIWLPTESFIPNGKGYPVLSKACQAFLRGMSKQNPTYVLSGTTLSKHPAGGPLAYLQYVRHITSTAGPSSSTSTASKIDETGHDYAQGYGDYLQAPLQPLMDDLGSATYDVFERDPVKYRQYEEAIYLALQDLSETDLHTITVVGAGRGPLVSCALRAMHRSNRRAKLIAVEKNASAFVTLQERKDLEWRDQVEIIFGDMRTIDVPQMADILVSELLGSFGDNELSPECLDGAMRFMKPNGISIPMSYTAHIAPISSSKLHQNVTLPTRPSSATETPYVVMLQQVNLLSGDGGGVSGRCGEKIQQCWQFEHPRRDLILDPSGAPLTNSHNTRSSTHTFHIPHAATLHGFAGYFESHLYGNVGLSIHPENMHRVSPDMFSWFPLFFPIKSPLYLPSNAELDVNLWRLVDSRSRKVWYEWHAEVFLPLATVGGGGGPPSGGSMNGSTSFLGGGGAGGGQPSPMMDAPYSPNVAMGTGTAAEVGRIKIGQTTLHNAGGVSSWVGL
ncbi:type II protein arginine methyltransferase, partial [Tremellales sp. Uapishka_1]